MLMKYNPTKGSVRARGKTKIQRPSIKANIKQKQYVKGKRNADALNKESTYLCHADHERKKEGQMGNRTKQGFRCQSHRTKYNVEAKGPVRGA